VVVRRWRIDPFQPQQHFCAVIAMRGAVASRERVLQAPADATFRPDEQPEDAQRLLGPRDELDAHRERREQLEAELQALASLDDAAFPYSPGNADPASCLCEC
jgi:hypothetical protein